jgi:polysaccharide export outer membrane protein
VTHERVHGGIGAGESSAGPAPIQPPDILRLTVKAKVEDKARQQLEGEHLVRPDGTISLGSYGSVRVAGMTTKQARAAVRKHLAPYLPGIDSLVRVESNSSICYVILDGGPDGQQVTRPTLKGAMTVRDAIYVVQPGHEVAKVWVVRPGGQADAYQTLPVDWKAVARDRTDVTNYRLQAGDRVHVMPWARPTK